MKITLSIIAILLLTNCGSGNTNGSSIYFEQSPPFQVEEASYQAWVAGTQEGGSGLHVYINFSTIQQGVRFKEVYFKDNKTRLITSPAVRVQCGYFNNKPQRDVIMDSNPINEAVNTPPQKIPFQLNKDDAVISYEFNGETAYYLIENLEEKKLLAYPGGNPNGEN